MTDCTACDNMPRGKFCIEHTCLDCMHRHSPDQPCHPRRVYFPDNCPLCGTAAKIGG